MSHICKMNLNQNDYDGEHPEISVCLWADGVCIQDIRMIRPYEENKEDVEVLVWGDEFSEDYTDRFVIPRYKEDENGKFFMDESR